MPLFSREPRDFDDLLQDPYFRFNFYRLIGAGEMISIWLMREASSPDDKLFGARLKRINDAFYGEKPTKPDPWLGVGEPGS